MKTFKNTKFVKRDYECTNVVFCQAETAPNENYKEVDESELYLSNCQPLRTENDVKYYGYL
jgi:hypothetical protein